MIFPLNRETVNYNVKNKRNIMKKRISVATLTALFYLFKSIQYVNKIVFIIINLFQILTFVCGRANLSYSQWSMQTKSRLVMVNLTLSFRA